MPRISLLVASLAVAPLAACAASSSSPAEAPAPAPAPASTDPAPALDAAIACEMCDAWNQRHEPFQLFGNTYYVGVAGLSAVVIATSDGLILLDGGLPQSAPRIADNLRALGLRVEDVRLIVNSHAHYDHAGGIAALQRLSGARVAASASGARALRAGEPTEDDPQARSGREPAHRFPAVSEVEVVRDGQTLTVGDVTITAHLTPGHTPGSTTWTWRSCEGQRCVDVVYADSLNAVSDDEFRFTADPGRVAAFERSIAAVDALPCDLLIAVHPSFAGLDRKLAARASGAKPDPFLDPDSCHEYAAASLARLRQRIADEG